MEHRNHNASQAVRSGPEVDLSGTLDQIAEATSALTKLHAQLQMLRDHGNESAPDDTNLAKVYDDVRRLTQVCGSLASATEHAIFCRLHAIAGATEAHIAMLLKYFEDDIKTIIKEASLLSTTGAEPALWKIAEVCYEEARDPRGSLNSRSRLNEYALHLVGAQYRSDRDCHADWDLEPPWHILPVLQSWVDFWARTMMSSPSGPTLFRPHLFGPSAQDMTRLFPVGNKMPRYLFRAFDRQDTSGGGSGAVVSGRWQHAGKETLGDILSLDPSDGLDMLLCHLRKPLFTSENDGNLKSWSSSLPFVVRYAVWRMAKRGVAASEVQICVVDTTKFPSAQFVRDRWLLRAYEHLPMSRPAYRLAKLRLVNEPYNNGEFLSQGRVDVEGRSSVFSVADLQDAGFFKLYPSLLDHPESDGGWTNWVRSLRGEWSVKRVSCREDIQIARKVASRCFAAFGETNIVLLLMAFKNRLVDSENDVGTTILPDEPIEARRYEDWADKFDMYTTGENSANDLAEFFCASPDRLSDDICYDQSLWNT